MTRFKVTFVFTPEHTLSTGMKDGDEITAAKYVRLIKEKVAAMKILSEFDSNNQLMLINIDNVRFIGFEMFE